MNPEAKLDAIIPSTTLEGMSVSARMLTSECHSMSACKLFHVLTLSRKD